MCPWAHTRKTVLSFEGLDDIWSQSFETDDYMIDAFKHEQALVDPELFYPSSPATQDQEVFFIQVTEELSLYNFHVL